MPTINAAGYRVPQVGEVEAPSTAGSTYFNIPAPLGAFGGFTADALTRFAGQAEKASDAWDRIQDRYDDTTAREAENRARSQAQKILYGNPDIANDTGYFGLTGRTAMDQRKDTLDRINKLYADERKNLPNARAAQMFDRAGDAQRLHNQALVLTHSLKEFQTYRDKEAQASVGLRMNDVNAAAARGDQEAFERNLGDALVLREQSMRERGDSEAAITAAKSELTSTAVGGWVLGRSTNDPAGALQYLEANKEHFTDAARYEQLHSHIKARADKAAGRDLADRTAAARPFTAPPGAVIEGATPDEQRFLNEVRFRESSNRYDLIHPPTKTGEVAGGAYGFLPGTWNEATAATGLGTEYPTADKAPPAVQDANALWLYRKYGTRPWAASGPYDGAVEQRQGGATRNLPIAKTVNAQLERAATAVGNLKVEVFSGGQPSTGPNRVGSHRHDEGGAADIQLRDVTTGQLLDMRKPEDRARMQKFITEAVSAGATGVGAAEDYMGPHGIHIGGGAPAVWGAGGRGANAPDWVRAAWEAGRGSQAAGPAPAVPAPMPAANTPERNKLSDDYAKALDQGFQGTVQDYWAQQQKPVAQPAAPGGIPDSPLAAQVARINASNASPEVKEAAIAELHRRHSAQAMGQDEAKYELAKAIIRGDESITPAYIDSLVKTGKISPEAGIAAQTHLDKEQRERQAKAEAIVRVNAAGSGGPPLDPKNEQDRKVLNYHYDVTSSLWPQAEALDRSVAYATQYGLVPDKLKSVIRGGLHSGRPDQVMLAADTVNRLRNANPQLINELGDENDLRLANLINSYTLAGVSAPRAIELATEGLKVDKTTREARTLDFEAQRGKTVKERADDDDRWIGRQQNSWLPGDPNIPSQMRQEFVEVSKAEFERTGNLEAARRTALDQVNRVWGRSFASGEAIPSTIAGLTGQGGQYMKFAPEKFYEVPGLSPTQNGAWMREQLLRDVAGSALQDPANPITPERIRLLPDPTRSANGLPVYQVWLVRPDAAWQHVVDAKGAPVLWKPDWNTSPEHQRRAEAQAQQVERARLERQEQIERERMIPR